MGGWLLFGLKPMGAKKTKIVFLGLILLVGLVWSAVRQSADNRLHLVFCDVGQGDAILITYGSSQILIDGGPNNQVLNCLANNMPFWDREIEMVVLTHPEKDHFGGLIDVIKRYDVKYFIVNSVVNDSAGFWEFREVVLAEKAKIHFPQKGDKIHFGPINFFVLWPHFDPGSKEIYDPGSSFAREKILGAANVVGNPNEASIVLKFSFGNFDALLAGDIGFVSEKKLDLANLGEIEVLKIGHHGSKYSSSEEFLAQIEPKLAVISVGKNSFGHPTEEVLGRLTSLGIQYLRTDQQGEIEIVSDGRKWSIAPR